MSHSVNIDRPSSEVFIVNVGGEIRTSARRRESKSQYQCLRTILTEGLNRSRNRSEWLSKEGQSYSHTIIRALETSGWVVIKSSQHRLVLGSQAKNLLAVSLFEAGIFTTSQEMGLFTEAQKADLAVWADERLAGIVPTTPYWVWVLLNSRWRLVYNSDQ